MAQNYADMTGQLTLTKITPIINALFGDMNVKEQAGGHAYIALMSECDSQSFCSVFEALSEVATDLGLDYEHDDENPALVLTALAKHFGVSPENSLIASIISRDDFDEDPSEEILGILFDLAMLFDDGHGLTSINTETAFHCSKPRQFEFGGHGFFAGKHFWMYSSSSNAGRLGESVNNSLKNRDVEQTADFFFNDLDHLLNGIEDESLRQEVKQLLAKRLTA